MPCETTEHLKCVQNGCFDGLMHARSTPRSVSPCTCKTDCHPQILTQIRTQKCIKIEEHVNVQRVTDFICAGDSILIASLNE
eukprot:2399543-Amphidinium_carterae.1